MSDKEVSEFDFSIAEIDELEREPEISVLKFHIGSLQLAIETRFVIEVLTNVNVTALPGVPDYIVGAFVNRGSACAVVDLNTWFWIPSQSRDLIVVVALGDWRIGISVDDVDGIDTMSEETDRAAEKKLNARVASYSRIAEWAPGGVVALLNVEKLLMEMALHVERKVT